MKTVFTLGPNTELILDDFIYKPNPDSYDIAARITKGIFRYVTGKIARKKPQKMKVKVGNVGTIGIPRY